jgi:hypothetical protein
MATVGSDQITNAHQQGAMQTNRKLILVAKEIDPSPMVLCTSGHAEDRAIASVEISI